MLVFGDVVDVGGRKQYGVGSVFCEWGEMIYDGIRSAFQL